MIYTGFDLETTGLLDPSQRIVEIAAVMYDDTAKKRLSWVQRVNPGRPIEPKAQAVHGISDADVAGEPLLEKVAPKLAEILRRSDVVVAHNGKGFDIPFVQQEFDRISVPLPAIKLVDTMLEARWATPWGKLPNLGELCFSCRVDYDPEKAHSAEYDVEVMMASFFHARKKGFFTHN